MCCVLHFLHIIDLSAWRRKSWYRIPFNPFPNRACVNAKSCVDMANAFFCSTSQNIALLTLPFRCASILANARRRSFHRPYTESTHASERPSPTSLLRVRSPSGSCTTFAAVPGRVGTLVAETSFRMETRLERGLGRPRLTEPPSLGLRTKWRMNRS